MFGHPPFAVAKQRPGDSVAVEDPVYPGLKNLLAGMGVRLVGIPLSADGVDLAQLARVLEQERLRCVIVTPNFQNPTGLTLSLPTRQGLLEAARAAGVPVVENDTYGELRYWGAPGAGVEGGSGTADRDVGSLPAADVV